MWEPQHPPQGATHPTLGGVGAYPTLPVYTLREPFHCKGDPSRPFGHAGVLPPPDQTVQLPQQMWEPTQHHLLRPHGTRPVTGANHPAPSSSTATWEPTQHCQLLPCEGPPPLEETFASELATLLCASPSSHHCRPFSHHPFSREEAPVF
jgi:hypothetical protein